MNVPRSVLALLIAAAPSYSQTSAPTAGSPDAVPAPQIPDDLGLLTGKKVLVGRMPLCVPGTYNVNLAYAGKPATITSYKPNAALARTGAMNLPPNMRATMEDARRGGKLTFRFEDGTILDTCGDMMRSQLASNVELAAGETLPAPATTASVATAPATPQQCPLIVMALSSGLSFGHALFDQLTTSELQRQIDSAQHGGAAKSYLDIKVRNDSQRPIKAFEYSAVYRNAMGDDTASGAYISQNTQPIRPGDTSRFSAMDRVQRTQSGMGDVKVFISRVRFDDDSRWEDNGSHSCSQTAASK